MVDSLKHLDGLERDRACGVADVVEQSSAAPTSYPARVDFFSVEFETGGMWPNRVGDDSHIHLSHTPHPHWVLSEACLRICQPAQLAKAVPAYQRRRQPKTRAARSAMLM